MFTDAPPLKVWAYTALTVFVILAFFLFYTYSSSGPFGQVLEASNKSLAEALAGNNTRDTAAISVVVLGSSLTERSLVDPREIENAISKQTNKKTNLLRVAIYSMNMDLAERMDFFGYISKYPPEYLFIENFCLNLESENASESLPAPIDASLLFLRNHFRNATGLKAHENYYTRWYTFDAKPLPDNIFYSNKFDSSVFKLWQRKKCVVRKVSQNETANIAFDTLLKSNTKIIFLDMPQSDKLQTNFLDKNSTAELNNLLEYYRQHYKIEYWKYPGILDDSFFVDGIHLNYKGAMKYQEWFASQFATIK